MLTLPIRVLLVEDNSGDVRLLQELLQDVKSARFELTHIVHLQETLEQLVIASFDVILLDLSLPDSRGLETFQTIYRNAPATPIVVLTGLDDEELATSAMQAGAQDYLVKGGFDGELLGRSIRYSIERKRAENRIKFQANLLRQVKDAVIAIDDNETVIYWNPAAERLYQWSIDRVLGRKLSSVFQWRWLKTNEATVNQALETDSCWQGESIHILRNGREIFVELSLSILQDERGTAIGRLIVIRDITERKQLEAKFLRSQRLESLGTLASGIAHDLNNILTPIVAVTQLLQLKFPQLDDHNQQLLSILEDNAKRGAALVKQILSFVRGMEGKREPVHIPQLIAEVEHVIQRTFPKSINIHTHLGDRLWSISADATQLNQVLMNLCINARDAMPEGGILSLFAENLWVSEQAARMHLDAHAGPYVVMSVTDTGVGIPLELLERIFDPFFTTKEPGKGTGLGLATVMGIIKGHGGFLTVSSELGQGSQFKIYLPSITEETAIDIPTQSFVPGQGELILIVDDEVTVREATQTSLEFHNYRVVTAHNGLEAVKLYQQHDQEIQVVLLDIMMPAMSGQETVRALQKINSQVKIVAFSGLNPSDVLAKDIQVFAFLPKPYTTEELLRTLHLALDESREG